MYNLESSPHSDGDLNGKLRIEFDLDYNYALIKEMSFPLGDEQFNHVKEVKN